MVSFKQHWWDNSTLRYDFQKRKWITYGTKRCVHMTIKWLKFFKFVIRLAIFFVYYSSGTEEVRHTRVIFLQILSSWQKTNTGKKFYTPKCWFYMLTTSQCLKAYFLILRQAFGCNGNHLLYILFMPFCLLGSQLIYLTGVQLLVSVPYFHFGD